MNKSGVLFAMGKAPAFQFYASDRAMELMGLDNEATGAWTRAVMYLWTSGPATEQRLADVAGKGWERVRFLFGSFDGGMGLKWMEEAREKQRIFRECAAVNGSKGGRPSRHKKGTLTQPKANQNPNERVGSMKIEGINKGKERAKENHDPKAGFIAACKAVVDSDPDRLPTSMRAEFLAYWTEPDAKGKMRFEAQKFFDHGRRMDTWRKRAEANPSPFAKAEQPTTVKPWLA